MHPALSQTIQAGWCNVVGGVCSLATLWALSIEHRLNAQQSTLSIVADHVHPFMTTVYHLLTVLPAG